MTADEIRVMSDDEALFIHGNKRPVKLRTTPYYQNARLRRRAELEAPSLPDPDAEEEESIPTLSIRPELPDEPDNWK
jgi:type IV secretory pathway TraG/TraD family ATPase VirD4